MKRVFAGLAWFILLWLGGSACSGAIVGGVAGSQVAPHEAATAGLEAGQAFRARYGGVLLVAALAVATVGTASRKLPGTKRRAELPSRTQRFHSRVAPFFISCAIPSLASSGYVLASRLVAGCSTSTAVVIAAAGLTVSLVISGLGSWWLSRAFPVEVLPDGLRSYTAWGRYHTLPWAAITRCNEISILGLRYLRVSPGGTGPTLWVPTWLADFPAFRLAAAEHAKPPLAQQLAAV
jgi:hypothetical protein